MDEEDTSRGDAEGAEGKGMDSRLRGNDRDPHPTGGHAGPPLRRDDEG
jgi:hypothetical protein